MSSPPPSWTPGPMHWKITTGIAIGALVVAAVGAGTGIYSAMRDQKAPTVRAIIDPDVTNLPSTKEPSSKKSACNKNPGVIAGGWGPERPMFDAKAGTSWVTLNSAQNNPDIGDERAFYAMRESGTTGPWKNRITLERGKEYVIRIYINNLSDERTAEGVRVKADLPTCTGRSITSDGTVEGTNTFPLQEWSSINMTASEPFNLAYISDSAHLYGNHHRRKGRYVASDFLTSRGALVGSEDLDGKVGSGYENALYFTFLVRPQFAEAS